MFGLEERGHVAGQLTQVEPPYGQGLVQTSGAPTVPSNAQILDRRNCARTPFSSPVAHGGRRWARLELRIAVRAYVPGPLPLRLGCVYQPRPWARPGLACRARGLSGWGAGCKDTARGCPLHVCGLALRRCMACALAVLASGGYCGSCSAPSSWCRLTFMHAEAVSRFGLIQALDRTGTTHEP